MTPTTAQVTLSLNAAQYFTGMSKVQAEAKTAAAGIASSFGAARTVLGGFAAVLAGTGLVSAATDTAKYAKEVDRLSTLSNIGAREFQGYAYAAKTVGIEQDKLADIFKDVQDKVGDFLQNGGGPLKDFFDNIAPRVGVTADQFKNLGGKDALQLYVSSLEKANLSQSEMTFYMEAIASDSTLLLPLLRDNGQAMSDLADEASRLGVVLDKEAIAAGKEFDQNLTRLKGAAEGLKVTIGNELIPWVNKLSNEFLTGIKAAGGFWGALRAFGTISPESSAAEGAKKYREELQRLTAARERLVETEGVMANTAGFDREIDLARTRLNYFNDLQRQGLEFSPDSQSAAEARRLGLRGPSALPAAPGGKTGKTGARTGGASGPKDDAADRQLETLRRQLQATKDLSVEETLLADIQAGRLGKVTPEKLKELTVAAQAVDAAKEQLRVQKELDALVDGVVKKTAQADQEKSRFFKNLFESTPTAQLEKQRQTIQMITDEYEKGTEGLFQLPAGSEEAIAKYGEVVNTYLGNVTDKQKEANENAQMFGQIASSAFEDAVLEGKKFSDVLKGLAQDLLRLVLRKKVTEPLAQAAGNFLSGLFSFDGGGWTGDGPRSGGVDGKGGFMAVLHPREQVIDTTKGGSAGGNVVINQYNTFSGSGNDQAQMAAWARQVKQETLAAVQLSANRGGSFASSVGRA